MYIRKLTEKGIYNNKEPEDLPDEREDDATHKLAAENKKQIEASSKGSKKSLRRESSFLRSRDDEQFPNKGKFLLRM